MTQIHHGLSRLDRFVKACAEGQALNDHAAKAVLPQLFGRLAPANPLQWSGDRQDLIAIYDAMVAAMHTTDIDDGPADAGMTFFGQFVDHDITLDATSSIGTAIDPRTIRNIRTPNLDLDCVYGDGPEASPHMYTSVDGHEGFLLFGHPDSPLDLHRTCKGTAIIGDHRNDENTLVSQIQGAFICLHNILLNEVISGTPLGQAVKDVAMSTTANDVWTDQVLPAMSDFQMVRRFIRLHYQWIVLTDFLPQFVTQDVVDHCLRTDPFGPHAPIMPVEFAGAAYRFGHATAQDTYAHEVGGPRFDLFAHQGFRPRGPDQDIAMAAFFGDQAQKARPVGPHVPATLFTLPFVHDGITMPDGTEVSPAQAAKLPLRNVLRDRFALHLPSGQSMAGQLYLDPIPVPQALKDHHITKTPLWFYCLQEAEGAGGKLTGVGGTIVASVIARILRCDPSSVVHVEDFRALPDFATMANMMAFVEAKRDHLPQRDALMCATVFD